MMKRPNQLVGTVFAIAAVVAGCSKGPAPGDALSEQEDDVVMAEREGASSGLRSLGIPAQEYARDYRSIPHDPHGPAAHLNPPASHVSGPVDGVDVGAVAFAVPDGWEYQHPVSSMRRAELGVRSEEGEGTAGLVVYFFGDRGAGSAKANIDRWVGQFKNADGTPVAGVEPVRRKVAGFDVTEVEVAGTYVGGMGSTDSTGTPDQRMIAAIVRTKGGPYYFKFLGDDAVVQSNRDAFERLLASMKPSDG